MASGYHQPTDLDEALELIGTRRMDVLAGGTDWFPARGRTPVTVDILDVTRVRALRGFAPSESGLRIGATTTWTEIAEADLPSAFDGLRAAAREVGGIQIQNAGTLAGNLCNASPAADGIPPLLTLGAEVEIAAANGRRRLPLADFISGPRRTVLAPGELVVAIHLPHPPEGARGTFEKLGARRYLVISIAMVAVVAACDTDGHITHARIAVGACSPVACRLPALERDLLGTRPGDVRISPDHLSSLAPIGDVRADADYRLEAVPRLIGRALRRACDG